MDTEKESPGGSVPQKFPVQVKLRELRNGPFSICLDKLSKYCNQCFGKDLSPITMQLLFDVKFSNPNFKEGDPEKERYIRIDMIQFDYVHQLADDLNQNENCFSIKNAASVAKIFVVANRLYPKLSLESLCLERHREYQWVAIKMVQKYGAPEPKALSTPNA